MESFTLLRMVGELRKKITGRRVEKVRQASAHAIAIKLGHQWLLISADSRRPRIHLVNKPAREGDQPGRFVLLAHKQLQGARLTTIEQPEYDRVVYIRFTSAPDPATSDPVPVELTLVAEMLGRSANVLLLDHSHRVIERLIERADERNSAGDTYHAPASRGKLNPLTLSRDEFDALVTGQPSLAEALVKRLAGFGPLYAAEVEARVQANALTAFEAFRSVLDDVFNNPAQPTVYSPIGSVGGTRCGAPDLLGESQSGGGTAATPYSPFSPPMSLQAERIVLADLRPSDLILSPIPLAQAAHLVANRFDSLSEAAAEYDRLVQKVENFHTEQARVISNLKSNIEKRERLIRNLEADLKQLGDYNSLRRSGELLLAGSATAKPTTTGFLVSDYYDPEQRLIEIPTESKTSPQKAAEEYFVRYRKAKRGHRAITEKIAAARGEIERFNQLTLRTQAAKTADDLLSIKEQIGESRRRRRASAPTAHQLEKIGKREKLTGVYCFVSSEEVEILVGKSDEDNDRLTFKYATPHDIWLHAADYPGSHVILRKSKGAALSHQSLVEAAQLAAFFSKARQSKKVVVHYTERKFVSKIRHSRPGLVRLADFKSITVEPAISAVRVLQ